MKNIYKLISQTVIFSLFILFCCTTFAVDELQVIKVAVLDNFHFQPYITNKFGYRYINGIKLANSDLNKAGYRIKYKIFDYSRTNPLAILASVDRVKKWEPDVILGPRNSNMFLLIKNSFKNILVISTFATSDRVAKMPSNYYSLMFPDSYMAKAMYKYINKIFPRKGVYAIVEADCKNCMDFSVDFAKTYNKTHNAHSEVLKQRNFNSIGLCFYKSKTSQ